MPAPPQNICLQILPYPTTFTPPPGTVLQSTVNFLPAGYLACDGAEVSRVEYAVLFNMIGSYYGDGDGTTTFNVPNLSLSNGAPYKYIIRYAVPDILHIDINPNLTVNTVQLTEMAEINIT